MRTPRPIPAPVIRPELLIAPMRLGADPGRWSRPRRFITAIHFAAEQGNHSWIRMMLSFGADPNRGNVINETALPRAYYLNHAGVVVLLLAGGAAPNEEDRDGDPPQHRAATPRRAATMAAAFRVSGTKPLPRCVAPYT